MSFAEGDHQPEETKNVRMLKKPFPIQPGGFVVLIVRIVIPSLSMQKFVACREHRNAIGKQQQAADIFCLTFAQCDNLWRNSFVAFPTTIPTVIVRGSVGVMMSVRLIARRVIRNKIRQRESIMRDDVINAVKGAAGFLNSIGKEIVAPVATPHNRRYHSEVAANKTANSIPEFPTPLVREHPRKARAQLVSAP